MSRKYAESRVRDALEATENNAFKAERMIMGWLEKDQSLLLGLVAPHLKAIITNAIAQAKNNTGGKRMDVSEEVTPASALARGKPARANVNPDEIGELGAAILGGSGRVFGQAAPSARKAAPKPLKASSRHVDALRTLSDKSRNRKDD